MRNHFRQKILPRANSEKKSNFHKKRDENFLHFKKSSFILCLFFKFLLQLWPIFFYNFRKYNILTEKKRDNSIWKKILNLNCTKILDFLIFFLKSIEQLLSVVKCRFFERCFYCLS